jgi:SHAQKYF class myb-like DNA-binding protein
MGREDPGGKARLRWTDELHARFEAAVESLGGLDRATPKVRAVQGYHKFHLACPYSPLWAPPRSTTVKSPQFARVASSTQLSPQPSMNAHLCTC